MGQPHRPQPNSTCVVKRAAQEFAPLVWTWAQDTGLFNSEADSEVLYPEFFALLFHAMDHMPDAYECGRYLEDEHQWPTDGVLIRLLDRAYGSLRYHQRHAESEWVLETGTRFPANAGDKITFRRDGKREIGVIKEVVKRAASAYVDVGFNTKIPQIVRVTSEDVLNVLDSSKRAPKIHIMDK